MSVGTDSETRQQTLNIPIQMAVEIKRVDLENKKEVKAFIRFNYELYKENPYSVPDLLEDMYETYDPKRNDAFTFCEADLFLALRDGKIVGRVACIKNNKANRIWNNNNGRFGWIDFIDDLEVSKALLDTAEKWAREHGCDKIVGPLGFTDMDAEGMLIDGFDQLSTMSTIYNFPYYPQHMEAHGYSHEIDWVERKIMVPTPGHEAHKDKYFRVAEIVKKRSNVHVRKFTSISEVKRDGYHYKIFDVVNRAYAPLYGYSEMTRRQIDKYVNQYLQFLDLRLLSVVENEEGEPVAMGVGIASLSHALQKAKGKLFPFGWWHLIKALKIKHSKIIDLLLVAVLPEYQSKGVNALLFADIIPIAQQMGFEFAESHPQLETNDRSQSQWAYLDCTIHKRRRCYQKSL